MLSRENGLHVGQDPATLVNVPKIRLDGQDVGMFAQLSVYFAFPNTLELRRALARRKVDACVAFSLKVTTRANLLMYRHAFSSSEIKSNWIQSLCGSSRTEKNLGFTSENK